MTWQELGDFYRVESITIDPTNPDAAYVTTEATGQGLQIIDLTNLPADYDMDLYSSAIARPHIYTVGTTF